MKKYLALFFLTGIIFGSNGKITGTVSQKTNGEPAVGVNIILVDSYMGAATDENGRFTILNVPPGTYSLRADAIGFAQVLVQNGRVPTSQTTELSIKLEESVVEGQEVTVVAERPLVQKDLTASQRVTSAKEIQDMPVESFLGVLTTHAGVNQSAGGALHVRGGRSNEVGYFIDGVSVSNPFFTNSLAVSVSNKALEEMKLVSGAFNAEYGNAMSGVVNVKIKDGNYKVGIRPHNITTYKEGNNSVEINGKVQISELSGSESLIHFTNGNLNWVSLSNGIQQKNVGENTKLYMNTDEFLYFDQNNRLVNNG